jgi:Kef-type K+ transport system membrane component KefB
VPEHGTSIILELFAIFVWTKTFAEVAEHLHVPSVIGEMLAGIVLGPYALGLIQPNGFTESVAEIGAVFLLLSVGLETHPEDLIRVGRKSIFVAVGGVVLPFVAGFGYIKLAGFTSNESIFVAAAMVATSVAVTARVLGDMRALGTRAAKIILGAAIFDDILGMLTLAVVAGLASSGHVRWVQLGVLSAEGIGFAAFMILVAPRVIRRIRPRIEAISIAQAPVYIVLAIGLGLSAAAEKIGLAAIIGAFFTGLAFAEYGKQWNLLPRIEGISGFLAPFFFFMVGTKLNLSSFESPSVLVSAILITLIAGATKLVGCGLPVIDEGWRTALQVGIGMVPRAEVGLIVAAVGLNMQLVSEQAYAIVVFMSMFTTLLGPPLLKLLFREQARGEHKVIAIGRMSRATVGKTAAGFLACGVIALALTYGMRSMHARASLPLVFVLVTSAAARLWGRAAGIFGTLLGAVIFATLLFAPLGSWQVRDVVAKGNLGWMILLGVMLAYFLGRDPQLIEHQNRHETHN